MLSEVRSDGYLAISRGVLTTKLPDDEAEFESRSLLTPAQRRFGEFDQEVFALFPALWSCKWGSRRCHFRVVIVLLKTCRLVVGNAGRGRGRAVHHRRQVDHFAAIVLSLLLLGGGLVGVGIYVPPLIWCRCKLLQNGQERCHCRGQGWIELNITLAPTAHTEWQTTSFYCKQERFIQ